MVAPGSDMTPCNKIDKPPVVYTFNHVMLCNDVHNNDKIVTFSRQNCGFKVIVHVEWESRVNFETIFKT